MARPSTLTNGATRELQAQVDYLTKRNTVLSDLLDDYDVRVATLESTLASLGFDPNGKPLIADGIPDAEVVSETAPKRTNAKTGRPN